MLRKNKCSILLHCYYEKLPWMVKYEIFLLNKKSYQNIFIEEKYLFLLFLYQQYKKNIWNKNIVLLSTDAYKLIQTLISFTVSIM